MKKFTLRSICVAIIAMAQTMFGADLLVEEFGVAPAYNSIQAAIDAANDADRIFIKNRTGDIPWVGDVTINKNVELLSYDGQDFFIVQGDYFVEGEQNQTISIIAMKNLKGSIATSFNSTGTFSNPAILNVMNCHLIRGSIIDRYRKHELNAVANQLDAGEIRLNQGKAIGNDINSSVSTSIYIYNATGSSYLGKTVQIIGNKCVSTSTYGIYSESRNVSHLIKNNFIEGSNWGINLFYSYGPLTTITNNTISCTAIGIAVNRSYGGNVVDILNNLITTESQISNYAISLQDLTQSNVNYNHITSNTANVFFGNPTTNYYNITDQTYTLDADGRPAATDASINGGHPASIYYNLDLTPNDAGCYGGSYSLDNFFPLFTEGPRVYMVDFPFNVRQGNTLDVKAYSVDR